MTTVLERTLSQVRAKIHRARVTHQPSELEVVENVDRVTSQLVAPILAALGWSFEDSDEVRVDFRLDGLSIGEGLALYLTGTPCLLVEVRVTGEEFDPDYVFHTLLPKAADAGFEWLLLTDGDAYSVFATNTNLDEDQRTLDTVRISDDCTCEALDFLELFSKERFSRGKIERELRYQFVDRKVEQALRDLFATENELAQLLAKKAVGISEGDIRDSLERADVDLHFQHHENNNHTHRPASLLNDNSVQSMSEAELRIATWLQRRCIERWAKGKDAMCRNRASQRRVLDNRRSSADRRSGISDRRSVAAACSEERREKPDRRARDRREIADRRSIPDRRMVRRRG